MGIEWHFCLYLSNHSIHPHMKKLVIFSLLVLALTSCSKDSIDPGTDNLVFVEKSEIIVTVTYLTWSDLECDFNCSGAGTQIVTYIYNAKVDVVSGDITGNDQQVQNRQFGTTGADGKVTFENLEPGKYTLTVDTPYGQKFRTIFTQLNRRSSVEFSF